MTISVFTSRESNQSYGRIAEAVKRGLVVITYHGRPRYVVMSFEDYEKSSLGETTSSLPGNDEILAAIERSRQSKPIKQRLR